MLKSGRSKNEITITLLALFAFTFALGSAQAFAGTIRERKVKPASPLISQGNKKYLLSVGIIAYPEGPLTGCVNDAISVMDLLTGEFGFDARESRLLKDREATRANILGQIERYIRLTTAGDLFVFFYSGHGTLFPDNRSLVQDETDTLDLSYLRANRKGFNLPDGRYDSALVPVDSASPSTGRRWENLILDDELFDLFSRMTVKGVAVILISDSCHSGTLARSLDLEGTPKLIDSERALSIKVGEIAIPDSLEKIDHRQMDGLYLGLTSSQDNQLSLDSKKLKQGFFTYAFTQVILRLPPAERKRLTYKRLYEICKSFVEKVSERTQTPKLDSRYYSGSLDEPLFNSPTVVTQPVSTSSQTISSATRPVKFHLVVRGRGGEAIANSGFALFRPEVQSVPAKGQITRDQTLLILRTQQEGEATGEATMALPGDYWIKVVCVGYKSLIERVRLTEDPQRRGYVRLHVVLDPE